MTMTLTPFAFEDNLVRVVQRDDGPWFVAADVCRVLDIANSRDALSRLEEDEKGVGNADTLGGRQEVNIVSESGLYALIFTSRKPEARRFRKWVTAEVLPAIRRTRHFEMAGRGPASETPGDMTLAEWLSLIRETRRLYGRAQAQAVYAGSPLGVLIQDGEATGTLDDSGVVRRFLDEAVEVTGDVGDRVRACDFIAAYSAWRRARDLPPITDTAAGRAIASCSGGYRSPDRRRFVRVKSSTIHYRGVRLRPDFAQAA